MIVPLSSILTDQYTRGGEFIIKNINKPYQGYYCIIQNNKYYTEKTYTSLSKELVKLSPQSTTEIKPNSIIPSKNVNDVRYFIKKINVSPILIKEINKNTYDNLNDPFYIKVSIDGSQIYSGSQELNRAEIKMLGLKSFLSNELDFSPPEG
jgi:hypothetical protein